MPHSKKNTPKPYWDRQWLFSEYVERGRSAADIASAQGCHENNILYWLARHGVPRRSISETRRVKHWGSAGPDNPMFGRSAEANPHWKGGITAERQALYANKAWRSAVAFIWKRDEATCQRCHRKAGKRAGPRFHIHHRVSFAVNEARVDVDNLVLLCCPCHRWIHSKKNIKRMFLNAYQRTLEGSQ